MLSEARLYAMANGARQTDGVKPYVSRNSCGLQGTVKCMHGCALPAVFHGVCNPNKPPSGTQMALITPDRFNAFLLEYVHALQVQTLVLVLGTV